MRSPHKTSWTKSWPLSRTQLHLAECSRMQPNAAKAARLLHGRRGASLPGIEDKMSLSQEEETARKVQAAMEQMERMGYTSGSVSVAPTAEADEREEDEDEVGSAKGFGVLEELSSTALSALQGLLERMPHAGAQLFRLLVPAGDQGILSCTSAALTDEEKEVVIGNVKKLRGALCNALEAVTDLHLRDTLVQLLPLCHGLNAGDEHVRVIFEKIAAWIAEEERGTPTQSSAAGLRSAIYDALMPPDLSPFLLLLTSLEERRMRDECGERESDVLLALPDEFHAIASEMSRLGRRPLLLSSPARGANAAAMRSSRGSDGFWSALFRKVTARNAHVFQYVLSLALAFAKRGQVQDVEVVMWPFPQLAPLLPLLSWTEMENPADQAQLLDVCYDDADEEADPSVAEECCFRRYMLSLAAWSAARLNKAAGEGEEEVDQKEILAHLFDTSILQVLEPCLGDLTSDDVQHLLTVLPTDRPRTVRAKTRSYLLIVGFNVLTETRTLVLGQHSKQAGVTKKGEGGVRGEDIQAGLNRVSRMLAGISDGNCLLGVVEEMFNTLFLCHEEDDLAAGPAYYASEAVVEGILKLAKSSLATLQGAGDLDETARERLAQFLPVVKEGRWRLRVLQSLRVNGLASEAGVSFVERWCMDAEELLVLCLRRSDFSLAKEVVTFFSMDREKLERVQAIEHIHLARSELAAQAGKPRSGGSSVGAVPAELMALLESEAEQDTVLSTCLEILCTTGVSLPTFVATIEEVDRRLSAIPPSFRSPASVAATDKLLGMCQSYVQQGDAKRVDLPGALQSTSSPEVLLLDQATIDAHVRLRQALAEFAVSGTIDAQAVGVLVASLSDTGSHLPLVRFVQYLLRLLEIFDLPLKECLAKAPHETIIDFVFTKGQFSQAEQFAGIAHLDLLLTIIEALTASSGSSIRLTADIAELIMGTNRVAGIFLLLTVTRVEGGFLDSLLAMAMQEARQAGHPLLERVVDLRCLGALMDLETQASDQPASPWSLPLSDLPAAHAVAGDRLQAGSLLALQGSIFPSAELAHSCFDALVAQGRLDDALAVADKFLPAGPEDFLLKQLVESKEADTATALIMRIGSKPLAASLAFSKLQQLEIDDALRLLSMLKASPQVQAELRQQIESLVFEMQLYKAVMTAVLTKTTEVPLSPRGSSTAMFATWQRLASACRKAPMDVIKALTNVQEYKLARKVAALFAVKEAKQRIEEEQLLDMLHTSLSDQVVSLSKLTQYMDQLPDAVATSLSLLRRLESPTPWKSALSPTKILRMQLYLTRFLLKLELQAPGRVPAMPAADLQTRELGIRALLLGPKAIHGPFLHLTRTPNSIVENLIMAEQLSDVEKLLAELPDLRDDSLLRAYAEKALDLSNCVAGKKMTAVPAALERRKSVLPSAEVRVTGADERRDALARGEFVFFSAPNSGLFKALLMLCSDRKAVADRCLEVANELSGRVHDVADELLVVSLVKDVLQVAIALQQAGAPEGVKATSSSCDALLSRADLLEELVIAKCQTSITLLGLSDKRKAEALRDRLIREDQMKLALTVASKCGLNTKPVWSTWGLSLLALGKYNQAKEMLANCLVERTPESFKQQRLAEAKRRKRSTSGLARRGNEPNADMSHAFQQKLVKDIITTLEETPMLENKILREQVMAFVRKKKAPRTTHPFSLPNRTDDGADPRRRPKVLPNSSSDPSIAGSLVRRKLDPAVYMQCVYYLTRYGGPEAQVKFWLRHNLLDDATRCILRHELPPAFFVTEMAIPQLRAVGGFDKLKTCLKKHDPELVKSNDCLLALCSYLSQRKAGNLLLDLQLFMGDNVRAGLTYISQFKKALITLQALELLEAGRQCLAKALNPATKSAVQSPLTESELTAKLSCATLQLQATQFFYSILKQSLPKQIQSNTLFGDKTQQMAVAEQVLVWDNFDLAFRIVQEFRLDALELYSQAIRRLARAERVPNILDLLDAFRSTVPEEDLDNITMEAITCLYGEQGDSKQAEKLIPRLSSAEARVRANLTCRKVKAAYLVAVQSKERPLVRNVLQHAALHGPKSVVGMCNAWLAKDQP